MDDKWFLDKRTVDADGSGNLLPEKVTQLDREQRDIIEFETAEGAILKSKNIVTVRDLLNQIAQLQKEIDELHAINAKLQAESVEREAVIKSYEKFVHDADMPCTMVGCGGVYSNYKCSVCSAIEEVSESPPTGFGARVLAVARAAYKLQDAYDTPAPEDMDIVEHIGGLEQQMIQAASALTPSDKKILGV